MRLTSVSVRYITIVFKRLHNLGLLTDIMSNDLRYVYCVMPTFFNVDTHCLSGIVSTCFNEQPQIVIKIFAIGLQR